MTNRTRSHEDGGTTGFRRMLDYPEAVPPRDLRTWLDPQEEDMPERRRVQESLTLIQRNSLTKIDEVAAQIRFFDARLMRERSRADLTFACALDHAPPRTRLRAMLARAYARADRYARACAEELEVRERAEPIARALDQAVKALSGPDGILWYKNRVGSELYQDSTINRALTAYQRMVRRPADELKGEREDLRNGLRVINQLRDMFHKYNDEFYDHQLMWPVDDEARFFFLLRLAEVYTISTGEVPTFSGYEPKGLVEGRARLWSKFARASLNLTGLGDKGFDDLSRRLGGKRPDLMRNPYEERYEDRFLSMAIWFDPTVPLDEFVRRQPMCAGNLLTAGRASDRKDSGEPYSWREHLF